MPPNSPLLPPPSWEPRGDTGPGQLEQPAGTRGHREVSAWPPPHLPGLGLGTLRTRPGPPSCWILPAGPSRASAWVSVPPYEASAPVPLPLLHVPECPAE